MICGWNALRRAGTEWGQYFEQKLTKVAKGGSGSALEVGTTEATGEWMGEKA